MKTRIGLDASDELYETAISLAARDLAIEVGIELSDYDISEGEYQDLMDAAVDKFSDCHQYRLYALKPNVYPCYTCKTKSSVILQKGQTFKISQTCGDRSSRYGTNKDAPQPDLYYLIEFRGNILEVLTVEYLKLLLFQRSIERGSIANSN